MPLPDPDVADGQQRTDDMADETAGDRGDGDRDDIPADIEQPDSRPAAQLLKPADEIGSEGLPNGS
jgi:hypothetical protein